MAFCGIDVGTQGVRAAILAADGSLLGSGAATMHSDNRGHGRHEQDPDDWWAALCVATTASVEQAAQHGVAADEIRAIALDATSGTVLVEDAHGAPTGPALMYDDARAAEQATRAQRLGAGLWHDLGYSMQPTWALPKIMWLLAADALPAGGRIAHQSDHLVRRLCGEPVATDTSNALKSGVDLRSVRWPADLFAELGVPVTALPNVVLPAGELGHVDGAAARETGLPAGALVRAGMTDGCAAQIASGALATGNWSSALGTTLVVKGSTAELLRDPSGAVYCHRHPDGGWLPGGASSSGARVIATTFDHASPADLDALTRRAASLVPVPGVTYPLTGRGERFPFVAADAVGFVSSGATDDAARFGSLCQAVAYVERLAYDVLAGLGADVSGAVALTGGATRNDWWNQLRADVLGRACVLPASAQAATGMAVLAAAEPGELTATAGRMIAYTGRLEPDAERHAALTAGYLDLVGELTDRGWLDASVAQHATDTAAVHS
ncbi:FGGY-family carbohydrate kinase [uncultured Jatrophihabitans sp.]|uniref:FGGY-family carbohydrate kinase n=1 Tax=uncultured Jatrophihabitans sp. TaxID=1610747 RepID=UPI0035C9A56B